MDRTYQAPPVIIYPRRVPVRVQYGGECCAKCALIFFTIMFLLIGFILTMVGHLAKPFWGPEDDWCDFCREDRLATENNLKNCRTVGPIFLAIGGLLLLASIFYCRVKKKSNEGQVIMGTPSGQMGPTSQGGTGTTTASTHYPANTFGFQQPYGQTPVYPPGSYPNNPPPPVGSYSPYPTGQGYHSPNIQHPYPPPSGQEYQPYPPPPSYDSAVDQSAPSAPPLEKVG